MSSNEGSNTGPIDSAASVCYNTIFVSPPNEPKRITRLTGQFPSAEPEPLPSPKYIEITDSQAQPTSNIDPTSEFDELTFRIFQCPSKELSKLHFDKKKHDFFVYDEPSERKQAVGDQEEKTHFRICLNDQYRSTFMTNIANTARVTADLKHFGSQQHRQQHRQVFNEEQKEPAKPISALSFEETMEGATSAVLYNLDLYETSPPMVPTPSFLQEHELKGYMYQIHYKDLDDMFLIIYSQPTVIVPTVQKLIITRSIDKGSAEKGEGKEERDTEDRKVRISSRASIHFVAEFPEAVESQRRPSKRIAVFKKMLQLRTPDFDPADDVPLTQYQDTTSAGLTIGNAEYDRVNERFVVFYRVTRTGADVEEPKLLDAAQGYDAARSQPKGEIIPIPTYKELMFALCRPGEIHTWMQERDPNPAFESSYGWTPSHCSLFGARGPSPTYPQTGRNEK